MPRKFLRKFLSNKNGFALGYVLILLGAFLAISTSLLVFSLAENKQSKIHAENIVSYYAAQGGADIAHSVLKNYINEVNNQVIDYHQWSTLGQAKDYLDFLKHGPLGTPTPGKTILLQLNLNAKNDYFLQYGTLPVVNDLMNGTTLQTSITLSSLGPPSFADNSNGDSYTYLFKYEIVSIGESTSGMVNRTRVTGEGTAMVKFTAGNFANFALFNHSNIAQVPINAEGWLTELTRIDGPAFTNDLFAFANKPVFNGPVSQGNINALFFNGG